MARNDTKNYLGVQNVKDAKRGGVTTRTTASNVRTHAHDVDTMRTRLKAIAPTTYTDKILDDMTKNDMLYALRVIDDAANIR